MNIYKYLNTYTSISIRIIKDLAKTQPFSKPPTLIKNLTHPRTNTIPLKTKLQAPLIILIRSKALLISLITLTFYVSKWLLSLWLYFSPNSAEAAPWSTTHSSWAKRKQLTLTNNSGSTLNANIPYQITVDII